MSFHGGANDSETFEKETRSVFKIVRFGPPQKMEKICCEKQPNHTLKKTKIICLMLNEIQISSIRPVMAIYRTTEFLIEILFDHSILNSNGDG